MPVIPAILELSARSANNATSPNLQVICAFPVSGQYGAGSRIVSNSTLHLLHKWTYYNAHTCLQLYYVLVLTCIFARKADWLRNACLAAALVVPAVAAIHAIVLASVHIIGPFCFQPKISQEHPFGYLTTTFLGAVDMDIYGAFQFCSIALLAAPLTVRLSRTYFYDPGRNIIFLWTILLLAGLVSIPWHAQPLMAIAQACSYNLLACCNLLSDSICRWESVFYIFKKSSANFVRVNLDCAVRGILSGLADRLYC